MNAGEIERNRSVTRRRVFSGHLAPGRLTRDATKQTSNREYEVLSIGLCLWGGCRACSPLLATEACQAAGSGSEQAEALSRFVARTHC